MNPDFLNLDYPSRLAMGRLECGLLHVRFAPGSDEGAAVARDSGCARNEQVRQQI
jgi:hypothetical protein